LQGPSCKIEILKMIVKFQLIAIIVEPRKKGLCLLILPFVQPFLCFLYLKIYPTRKHSIVNCVTPGAKWKRKFYPSFCNFQ
jgi:hypothetical protein